jgi:hypothetical protein
VRPHVFAFVLASGIAAAANRASAQAPAPPPASDFAGVNVPLESPLFDARVNGRLASWPAMQQSLMWTKGTYSLAHAGLLSAVEPWSQKGASPRRAWWILVLADLVLTRVPLGDAWLHEEWHRAVMSRRGIESYNGVYDFDVFADTIPVRKVRDEDLIRLKRDHPAEMVRLSSAGFEAQIALNLEFDRDRFYRGTRAGTVVTQWSQTLNTVAYVLVSAYDSEDRTDAIVRGEGTDVAERDFTGLDPVGWVYDLHRPDEPYEDRGRHPSGVGIDRYRTESDLTPAERRVLRTQAWLSLVNLADPNLYGFYGFAVAGGGAPGRFNASVQHLLAPFGYTIRSNWFLSTGRFDWFAQADAYVSDSLVRPGLAVELVRFELPAIGLRVSPGVRGWIQPEDQRYFADSGDWGGAAKLRLHVPLGGPLELFVEGSVKSDGWIAGDVFLDRSANAVVGLEALVF